MNNFLRILSVLREPHLACTEQSLTAVAGRCASVCIGVPQTSRHNPHCLPSALAQVDLTHRQPHQNAKDLKTIQKCQLHEHDLKGIRGLACWDCGIQFSTIKQLSAAACKDERRG